MRSFLKAYYSLSPHLHVQALCVAACLPPENHALHRKESCFAFLFEPAMSAKHSQPIATPATLCWHAFKL
jgi:hypothetical protein